MNILVCVEFPKPSRASRAALDLAGGLADNAQILVVAAGGAIPDLSLAQLGLATAHRVFHVQDLSLDKADYHSLGLLLAEVARYLDASLVLTGEHSEDEGQGLVPAAIAHHLHAYLVTHVENLGPGRIMADAVVATVRAGGRRNRLEIPLPVVFSTTARPTREKSPHAPRGGRIAPSIETLTLPQLGLDPGLLTPRGNLLGTFVHVESSAPHVRSLDELARTLGRRPGEPC